MRPFILLGLPLLLLLNGVKTQFTPIYEDGTPPSPPTAVFPADITTQEEITTTDFPQLIDRCVELDCTENERCGKRRGVYGCLCKESHTRVDEESYDSIEFCESSTGSMSLSRCQLFEAGFSTDVLHLSDPSCRGTVQNGRLKFQFDNDGHVCGTNLTGNGTHIIYENSIRGETFSSVGPINRKKYLDLSFSCIYQITQILTMDTEFKPYQRIINKPIPGGQGVYQVRLIPYMDAGFSHPYTGSVDIEVNQKIYVGVFIYGVDSRQIATVIDSCWATPTSDPNHAVRWDLIVRKCPNPEDKTVEVLQNGVSTSSRFSFNMFAFNSDDYKKVYLHCTVQLCLLQDNNCAAHCFPGHHQRFRRSVEPHDSASISVGPFIRTASRTV